MGVIASQITSLKIVYSTVYSDADQRKHQSSAALAFVRGIHRWPVNSPHIWPVTRKMFPFDDVILYPPELPGPFDNLLWDLRLAVHPTDTAGCNDLSLPLILAPYHGQGQVIYPTDAVGCNYLSMHLIQAPYQGQGQIIKSHRYCEV